LWEQSAATTRAILGISKLYVFTEGMSKKIGSRK